MTGIYKTGTIALDNNSNIVIGTGTLFQTVANAREGDLFTLDGNTLYEIYQVDTETQLRIRNLVTGTKYQGESVSGVNYAIVRNFAASADAQIASDVVSLQQRWHEREREMTQWFASEANYHQITDIKGDKVLVITPTGLNNLVDGPVDIEDFGLISAVESQSLDLNDFPPGIFYTRALAIAHQPTDFGDGVKLVVTNKSDEIFYQKIVEISTAKARYRIANAVENADKWQILGGDGDVFPPADHLHSWESITDKPETFPSEPHSHSWDSVTNKPDQATRWPNYSEVTGKPSEFTPEEHTHSVSDIPDLPVQATRWPSFSEVTGMVSKNQLPPVSSKVNSVFDAIADTELGVGELVETVSYLGDFADQKKAYGGNTYLKISGQSYTQDLCRYIYTDDGNTLVALFPDGIVTPEQAGAKPVTTFNSGDAISVANAVATALRYPLIFKGQDYDCGNKSFKINVYRTRWEGQNGMGTYLKWNTVPENGYAVQLYGENVYEQNDRMSKPVFQGLNIVGASKNNEYDADAIQFGGNTSATKLSCCAIDKVNIRGFKITFRYHDYTWKIHITQCRTIGGCIETPPEQWQGALDMGECMVIRDSFLADTSGKTTYFRRGEWKIIGTSFNNHPIEVLGGCIWTMIGSHIENPLNNSLTTKFLTVKGYAKALIRDTWITTNNRALIEPPLISEVPDTKTGGLFLENVTWNMNDVYDPRGNGYDHQYIIGGSGRCGAKGMNYLNWQTYLAQPIAEWTNMLGNGGFERGDTSGWSIRVIDTSGGDNASCDLIAEATTDVPRGGSYVGKFTANYGGSGGVQGGELYQGVPCKSGDIITGGVYLKNDWDASDNAGLFQVIVYFFDASGNRIDFPDQYGNTIQSYVPGRWQTHVENWTYRQIGIVAPKGAARVEVCVQVLTNTATPNSINAWVDNFHVEVQEYM